MLCCFACVNQVRDSKRKSGNWFANWFNTPKFDQSNTAILSVERKFFNLYSQKNIRISLFFEIKLLRRESLEIRPSSRDEYWRSLKVCSVISCTCGGYLATWSLDMGCVNNLSRVEFLQLLISMSSNFFTQLKASYENELFWAQDLAQLQILS